MRRASLCTAAFGMFGLVLAAPAAAQDMMRHVDLTSPEMTAAELTRAEVETAIAGASHANQGLAERLAAAGAEPVIHSMANLPAAVEQVVGRR